MIYIDETLKERNKSVFSGEMAAITMLTHAVFTRVTWRLKLNICRTNELVADRRCGSISVPMKLSLIEHERSRELVEGGCFALMFDSRAAQSATVSRPADSVPDQL